MLASLGRFAPSLAALLGLSVAITANHAYSQPVPETVFFDVPGNLVPNPIPAATVELLAVQGYPIDAQRLTLIGQFYTPDAQVHGSGPYPTVIMLHGSGGLWSLDNITKGPANQFKNWAEVLTDNGYALLLVDSFNPRGIPGNFSGRKPHHDASMDDAVCSPNYERPKDVIAALAYLDGRSEVDRDQIGLIGFSHGAQTGLNAILDPSVDLGNYMVDYIGVGNVETEIAVDSPVRIPNHLPFPKVCAFYYPGGAHYGYHGQASSVVAGRYMPDRRTKVLMFHGTEDGLLGVDDPEAAFPLTGNLFPIKQVESSALQAAAEGIDNPFVQHTIFDLAEHSFDGETIEPEMNWNTPSESVDEKAKRLSRDEVFKWFECLLKPSNLRIEPDQLSPGDHVVVWTGRNQIQYQLVSNEDLSANWSPVGNEVIGDGMEIESPIVPPQSQRLFYRLEFEPTPVPSAAPENTGFILDYSDFSY